MIVSHSKKFILINIYKTASITVNEIFKSIQDHKGGFAIPDKHLTALEIRGRFPKAFNAYFKAATVRNPWDWQVSQYSFLKDRPEYDIWNITERFPSFEQFIERRCTHRGFGHKTQTSFIADTRGRIIVDYIFKMEELVKGVNHIARKLDMPLVKSLPIKNQSNRDRDYRKYYTERTAKLLQETFIEDIENFDYHFEDYEKIS